MNNENNELFTNDVETNVSEENIILVPPAELIEEAKEIAQNTKSDEKFPFTIQYDTNQKEFLLSMLETVGVIVEDNDEEGHMLSAKMNMTQLAFIKCLDCVERVKTDEGINPFLAEEAVNLETVQDDHQDSKALNNEAQEIIANTGNETLKVQTELSLTPAVDINLKTVASTEEDLTNDSVSVAVAATARSSCCPHPTNLSMEAAATISDESHTSGYICCPGAEQWFKFVAKKTDQYTICTTGSLDTIGTLYDCRGNLITEVDDYAPCGKINFRIIQNLTAGNTYYIKVRLHGENTGNYTLRVTDSVFANYVTINKNTITLAKGVTYELPITPNYTYKGYNGAQRISGLSVSINPSNANEQKISWWEQYGDVLECSYGWDDDGDRYIHVTATGIGTAKLYAQDWNENGKRDECTVTVIMPYCGGDNYRDVTQHTMILQSDGYYVCSKCGYRIKSPALQDKDILSQDDYIKMIAVMHYYAHNLLLAREYPISAYFYNAEAEKCKIVMDTIRSQNQYSSAYQYQGSNSKYLAGETNSTMASFVSNSAINAWTIGSYNGFYETIATLVIGYYCPEMGTLIDIISLAKDISSGEMDAISFGSFIAGLMDLDDIATALSFFSSASDVIDCDVVIGDPVVRISFSAYAHAEYVFDTDYNIKKVSINYTV